VLHVVRGLRLIVRVLRVVRGLRLIVFELGSLSLMVRMFCVIRSPCLMIRVVRVVRGPSWKLRVVRVVRGLSWMLRGLRQRVRSPYGFYGLRTSVHGTRPRGELRRWRPTPRPLRRPRFPAAALVAIAHVADVAASLPFAGRRGLQDSRPVELDIRIVLFEKADRGLVDRRATDAHARRRAEPVEQAFTAPSAGGLDESGRLIAVPIAVEAQVRQSLLPPGSRGFVRGLGRSGLLL
jgi:hypothetical protein